MSEKITSARYNADTATIEVFGVGSKEGWLQVHGMRAITRPRWVRRPRTVRAKRFKLPAMGETIVLSPTSGAKESLNDRVLRLASEGRSPEEIADLLIEEKKAEVERQRKKK